MMMPVIVSDYDAACIRSQLTVLMNTYQAQPPTEYTALEIRILKRLIAKLLAEQQEMAGTLRCIVGGKR